MVDVAAIGLRPKGIVVLGPAWVACGSYEVFRRQMACCRELGIRSYFLAIAPTFGIANNNAKFWHNYYKYTTNLGADDRGHTGRAKNVFKYREIITDLPSGLHRSVTFWKSMHTRFMPVPNSLKEFISKYDISTVICHHYFDMPLAKKIQKLIPCSQLILETQDVQTNHYLARKEKHPIWRRPDSESAMLRDEMQMSGEADILVHYNDKEAETFKSHLPSKKHITVYPAFPRNYLLPITEDENKTFDFLVVAASNAPNYISIKAFLEDVWLPVLQGKRTLRIVGHVDWSFNLANDPLVRRYPEIFVGVVPDLTPWYQLARYVILPVLEGQGIAIKTVQALSFGKQTVAMPLAYRGFADKVPRSLISEVVATPQEFQHRLLSLDTSQNVQQDPRAIKLYEELFTTERQTAIYRELLTDVSKVCTQK
jgi:polysaccharide biosynthesis protein PslH